MRNPYLGIYERLPEFLKQRIHPLEYAIRSVAREAAAQAEGGRVLDAGAGEARFRSYFRGCRYFSLDAAVGDGEWDYSRIDLLGDLHRLPLRSESFDLILNLQVLEHVSSPRAVLQEMARVLKPGGRLYLTAPQGWHEHQQPHDYYRFTRFALADLAYVSGFREVSIEPLGGFFHYLGNRLTFVPKVLFGERSGPVRVLLLPLEFLTLVTCSFLAPLLCSWLDRFDRKREFTLCYRLTGLK